MVAPLLKNLTDFLELLLQLIVITLLPFQDLGVIVFIISTAKVLKNFNISKFEVKKFRYIEIFNISAP